MNTPLYDQFRLLEAQAGDIITSFLDRHPDYFQLNAKVPIRVMWSRYPLLNKPTPREIDGIFREDGFYAKLKPLETEELCPVVELFDDSWEVENTFLLADAIRESINHQKS